MFGELLEDVMALQKTRFPDRKLPWIVVALTEEIHRLGAPKTEGIFRYVVCVITSCVEVVQGHAGNEYS